MNFQDAIIICFQKFARFDGRATRPEFWWFALFTFVIGVACGGVSESLRGLWFVITLLPVLAVGSRRLHDTNRSGWWQLLSITVIGVIVLIVWWCLASQPEKNRFDSQQV